MNWCAIFGVLSLCIISIDSELLVINESNCASSVRLSTKMKIYAFIHILDKIAHTSSILASVLAQDQNEDPMGYTRFQKQDLKNLSCSKRSSQRQEKGV